MPLIATPRLPSKELQRDNPAVADQMFRTALVANKRRVTPEYARFLIDSGRPQDAALLYERQAQEIFSYRPVDIHYVAMYRRVRAARYLSQASALWTSLGEHERAATASRAARRAVVSYPAQGIRTMADLMEPTSVERDVTNINMFAPPFDATERDGHTVVDPADVERRLRQRTNLDSRARVALAEYFEAEERHSEAAEQWEILAWRSSYASSAQRRHFERAATQWDRAGDVFRAEFARGSARFMLGAFKTLWTGGLQEVGRSEPWRYAAYLALAGWPDQAAAEFMRAVTAGVDLSTPAGRQSLATLSLWLNAGLGNFALKVARDARATLIDQKRHFDAALVAEFIADAGVSHTRLMAAVDYERAGDIVRANRALQQTLDDEDDPGAVAWAQVFFEVHRDVPAVRAQDLDVELGRQIASDFDTLGEAWPGMGDEWRTVADAWRAAGEPEVARIACDEAIAAGVIGAREYLDALNESLALNEAAALPFTESAQAGAAGEWIAVAAIREGVDNERAKRAAEAAIEAGAPGAFSYHVEQLRRMGEAAEALEVAQLGFETVRDDPVERAELYRHIGDIRMRSGEFARASDAYRHALETERIPEVIEPAYFAALAEQQRWGEIKRYADRAAKAGRPSVIAVARAIRREVSTGRVAIYNVDTAIRAPSVASRRDEAMTIVTASGLRVTMLGLKILDYELAAISQNLRREGKRSIDVDARVRGWRVAGGGETSVTRELLEFLKDVGELAVELLIPTPGASSRESQMDAVDAVLRINARPTAASDALLHGLILDSIDDMDSLVRWAFQHIERLQALAGALDDVSEIIGQSSNSASYEASQVRIALARVSFRLALFGLGPAAEHIETGETTLRSLAFGPAHNPEPLMQLLHTARWPVERIAEVARQSMPRPDSSGVLALVRIYERAGNERDRDALIEEAATIDANGRYVAGLDLTARGLSERGRALLAAAAREGHVSATAFLLDGDEADRSAVEPDAAQQLWDRLTRGRALVLPPRNLWLPSSVAALAGARDAEPRPRRLSDTSELNDQALQALARQDPVARRLIRRLRHDVKGPVNAPQLAVVLVNALAATTTKPSGLQRHLPQHRWPQKPPAVDAPAADAPAADAPAVDAPAADAPSQDAPATDPRHDDVGLVAKVGLVARIATRDVGVGQVAADIVAKYQALQTAAGQDRVGPHAADGIKQYVDLAVQGALPSTHIARTAASTRPQVVAPEGAEAQVRNALDVAGRPWRDDEPGGGDGQDPPAPTGPSTPGPATGPSKPGPAPGGLAGSGGVGSDPARRDVNITTKPAAPPGRVLQAPVVVPKSVLARHPAAPAGQQVPTAQQVSATHQTPPASTPAHRSPAKPADARVLGAPGRTDALTGSTVVPPPSTAAPGKAPAKEAAGRGDQATVKPVGRELPPPAPPPGPPSR